MKVARERNRVLNFFKRGQQLTGPAALASNPDLTHIDCQGLAGAWTLGTAQAGFELVHRASLGKFGDDVLESNRALVPGPWEQDPGAGFTEWEPQQAAYLTGTPPCSGFSLLNNSKKGNKRGPESSINDCMKELIAYAGACRGRDGKKGPEVVAFESVQGAFKQGRSLMQWLRADLETRTGQKYTLTHVLTSGSTIGAAQMRHRYYFVTHRVPFGIDKPEQRRVVTYRDALGDLLGLKDQWEPQNVKAKTEQMWWLDEQKIVEAELNLKGGWKYQVDAHIGADNPRVRIMIDQLEPYWPSGKSVETALRNYRTANGDFPEGTSKWWDHDQDIMKGFAHPTRINPDRPGYVCTGGCVFDFVHWKEPRFLSVRECARLMGYPDNWTWSAARTVSQAGAYVGKCCPVTTGKWISTEVKHALEGNPGSDVREIGDREYLHDSTLLYKPWLKEQQADTVGLTPKSKFAI
jgi:site-specific DNA-cytosine methylase